MIIGFDEKSDDIIVNFHVNTQPSFSAKTIMMFYEINEVNAIYIGDDFLFDDDGLYVDGEKAYKMKETKYQVELIDKFLKDQSQKYILQNSDGYSC